MSDLVNVITATIAAKTEEANAIASEVAAATVNVNKQIRDLREDAETDDEKVQKWQAFVADLDAKREQATKAIDAYLAEKIGAASMSDEERDEKKSAFTALRDEIRAAEKLLAMQGDEGKAAAESLPDLLNFSGRKSGSGGGSQGPRPRLAHATVNGEDVWETRTNKDGDEEQFVTFTVLAQHISKDSGAKVGARDLQAAAFEEAGTNDLSTVTEVDFGFSADGNNYRVVVFPRQAE